LRSLEFAPDRQTAQSIARIATSIFNNWNILPRESENEDINNKLTTNLSNSTAELEIAHEGLRTSTLTQWATGSLPGPHIQTLLELLLAARSVLPPGIVKSRLKK